MSPVGPIQGPDGAPMQGPPRAHGGRRPTKWGSGGGAPRKSIFFVLACATAGKQKSAHGGGPKGFNFEILMSLWSYFGPGRPLELCKIAIGFISTEFQDKNIIPDPVWIHFSFWIFGPSRGRTWDQGMRQYLGPEYEAVPGTRV